MKKITSIVLIVFLVVSSINMIWSKEKNVEILYNGKVQNFSHKAITINNLAYLPLRELFENQKYSVSWATGVATCLKDDILITFNIKKNTVTKNGIIYEIGDSLMVSDNRYMIALNLVSKLMSVDAEFDIKNNKVLMKDLVYTPYSWVKNNKLIAHALGGIEASAYTNSLNAFQYNYSSGFKLFEADLCLTSDGKLALTHDWSTYLSLVYGKNVPTGLNIPLSTKEFMSMKINKHMTPLSFDDLAKLMIIHEDVYIVTDTKETDADLINKQFTDIINTAKKYDASILNRIIPQIYNEDMYYQIQNMYNFNSYIYTLYMTNSTNEQVIDFMSKNKLEVATMPTYRATSDFTSKLKEKGINTYTHTVNSIQDVRDLEKSGVYGFYTDYITPSYYNLAVKE